MKNRFHITSVLHLLFGLLLLLPVSACKPSYNLEGNVAGLGDDPIIFVEYVLLSKMGEIDEPKRDTIYANDGKLHYDVPVNEPVLVMLFPRKSEFKRLDGHPYWAHQKSMVLVLDPDDEITIHGELKEFYLDYRAAGSEFNEQFSEIRQRYIEKTSEAVRLELEIDTLMFNNGDSDLIDELFQKRNEIGKIASAEHLTYIKNNWDKELSAYFLARQPLDTLGRYYANLSTDVREGVFNNMLENRYLQFQRYSIAKESEQNLTEGSAAPDFTLEKLDGTKFTLSSLRHSYIVVYFWGSWCPPCIREFPQMKEYYHKYKNEVEFVGISHGDSDEEWRKAVEAYSLDWTQVINNPDVHIDVPAKYGVMAYPTKFILDEDLKILGKYIGASDDFYKKLDQVIKRRDS